MVGMLVPLSSVGSVAYHPPIGRKNTTYIPLIVLAEPGGWKMRPTDPTFEGNQKQPLIKRIPVSQILNSILYITYLPIYMATLRENPAKR